MCRGLLHVPDRPLDPVRRLRPSGRGSDSRHRRGRRLDSLRRHGQSLRPEPDDRADGGGGAEALLRASPRRTRDTRRTSDGAAGGCRAGLAFNPALPLEVLEYVLDEVDLVLIMSVNPGFGGQSFIDSTLKKVERARQLIDAAGRDIRLEVDGGIKIQNIQRAAAAGADTFVAGSAIFGCADYKAVIDAMRYELRRPSLASKVA